MKQFIHTAPLVFLETQDAATSLRQMTSADQGCALVKNESGHITGFVSLADFCKTPGIEDIPVKWIASCPVQVLTLGNLERELHQMLETYDRRYYLVVHAVERLNEASVVGILDTRQISSFLLRHTQLSELIKLLEQNQSGS